MKKIGIILITTVLIAVGVYYIATTANSWSTKETLDGYDSEAAAEATPVESFENANSNTSGNGLNPAHGQPGHRCDIAVGAPLNAPLSNSSMLNTNTMLNPEHGQPGHRCDIAVGAPLPTS
ncbi:hypothetical protein [Joostella sp. CR20]|uniref:hypothetical protein n=1 Tax=Joostella sp. CR20 TaxID=2804312 RepID=UPI00313F1AE8